MSLNWTDLPETLRRTVTMVVDFMKTLNFDKLQDAYSTIKQEAVQSRNTLLQRIFQIIDNIIEWVRHHLSILTFGFSERFLEILNKLFSRH